MVAAEGRMSFKAKFTMKFEVRLTKVFWLLHAVLGPEVFVTLVAITVLAEPAFHRIVHGKTAIGADG